MCGYVCVEFIYFMLKGKSFLDYTNLFSSNSCKNNDEIILKNFKTKRMKALYCVICDNYQNFEKLTS